MNLFYFTKNISCFLVLLLIFSCNTKPSKTEKKSKGFKQIDSLITTSYERELFNGNILVAKNDTIIYQKSFGYTDSSEKIKLDDKSIFNIGSIAKEFNAISIMILSERGLLSLGDPISKFDLGLPDWSKKITISHLLNYAGGLPTINMDNKDGKQIKSDEDTFKDLRNLSKLLFEPGTDFNYNNNSVFLQRRIVEEVTNQTFEQFVKQNIIEPLNITNSVFDPSFGYSDRTSCFDLDKVDCPELEFISGWLWLDTNDLYKWINALKSNQLITEESLKVLLKNPYKKDYTTSIGEFDKTNQVLVHNGISYNFESIYINDFKNNFVIILLSNNKNRVWDLGHTIHNLLLGEEYEIPKKSIYQAIRKESLNDVNIGVDTYNSLKINYEK